MKLAALLFCGMILAVFSPVFAQEADEWEKIPAAGKATLQIQGQSSPVDAQKAPASWQSGPLVADAAHAARLKVAASPSAKIRWFQLIPDTTERHKNANFPWDPDPYKWIGITRIPCERRELAGFRDHAEILIWPGREAAKRSPTDNPLRCEAAGADYHDSVGSFWFQVEIEEAGKRLRSPGLAESTEHGLHTSVFRLSLSEGEGFLGMVTTFFNVPALFGSLPKQSFNYQGVDCADCLMAAWSRWCGEPLQRDWNVAGLVAEWPRVAEFDLEGGVPSKEIRWGADVQPGDFIAVKYAGRKTFQHIGALCRDANNDGKLNAQDQIIHAGPDPLRYTSLQDGSFAGHIVVLRGKKN